ncbi:BppU family phage baseplate upper protein [Furfurilactobacillus milii]|uniref:DUF2479 domain-containing protein n=1 Tax=Furfurilactobacillus rossiae TaxID=231049 RepID=A0A7C9IWS6_9LACO|nr:BppU family phage baseplate upper protein [Furfurilactobacillus milii]MYV04455.1 DUF2479 domain-containing protein [Furfurilactobacillus milii]
MAQDSAGRTIVPAGYNGNFEVVDMNFNDDTKVIQINQLNGRQGDTRTARIKAVQDNSAGTGTIAYSIDGLQPQIVGKDAKDKTIQIAGNWNPINVNLGLFSITAPANVYQAVGLTQGCYLRLVDGSGNVVSSIPVIFEVIQDSSSMTNYEATAFLQSVDSVAQQAVEKFDSANALAQTVKDVSNQALAAAQQADADAKAQGVAKLASDNAFTGNNSFSNKVTAANFVTPGGADLNALANNVTADIGWIPLALSNIVQGNIAFRSVSMVKPSVELYMLSGQVTTNQDLSPYTWYQFATSQPGNAGYWKYTPVIADSGVNGVGAFQSGGFSVNFPIAVNKGTNIQVYSMINSDR